MRIYKIVILVTAIILGDCASYIYTFDTSFHAGKQKFAAVYRGYS